MPANPGAKVQGMSRMLTPLERYPVHPVKRHDESLVGYVRRCYWGNGYEPPTTLSEALYDLYRGFEPEKAFETIATVIPPSESVSGTWWVTQRLDAISANGKRHKWLRFHYSPARYCPSCLKEDGIHREPWTWPLVSACARHQCQLVARCHGCGESSAWWVTKSGWTCICGAQHADAPSVPALPWEVRLAGLFDEALNAREPFESRQGIRAIYDFLGWAYVLRRQLSRRRSSEIGLARFTQPNARIHMVPDAWEESLFMAGGNSGQRRLHGLLKWCFREMPRSLLLLQSDGPLLVALKALDKLPRNHHTALLLDEADALRRQHCAGIESCPDVYFHPDLSKQDRQIRLVAFARWWHAFAMRISPLAAKDRLTLPSDFTYPGCRSDLVIPLLSWIFEAAFTGENVERYSALIARWHVPKALQQVIDPDQVLNELGNYLAGLRSSELAFVLDLVRQSERAMAC